MEARRQPSLQHVGTPRATRSWRGDLRVEQPSGRITTQVPITQIVQVQEITASNVLKVSPDWNGSTLQKQISGHWATYNSYKSFKKYWTVVGENQAHKETQLHE